MSMDFSRLVEESDPFLVASSIGMEIRKKSSKNLIYCPGHLAELGHEDRNMGNAWLTEHGYYCSACGKSKSIICMVQEFKNISFFDAACLIADLNGGVDLYKTESTNDYRNEKEKEDADRFYEKHYGIKSQRQILHTPVDYKVLNEIGLGNNRNDSKCFYPILSYGYKPVEKTLKYACLKNGNWKYDYIVNDSEKTMSLNVLCNEDFEAYVYLVITKSLERIDAINNILKVLNGADEFSANLTYILKKKKRMINKALDKLSEQVAKELQKNQ